MTTQGFSISREKNLSLLFATSRKLYEKQILNAQNWTNPKKFFNLLCFRWLLETFNTGFHRELNLSDLHYPLDEHSSHNVGETMSTEWKKEQKRCKDSNANAQPNLTRVLVTCFGRDIMLAGMVQASLEFILRYIVLRKKIYQYLIYKGFFFKSA